MKKILIADDTDFCHAMLKDILNQHGITDLYEVSKREDILPKTMQLQPDIILLNMDMEQTDSLTLTSEIKLKFPQISVLLMTDETQEDRIIDAITAGANGFIMKPFQAEKVLQAIRPFLAQ